MRRRYYGRHKSYNRDKYSVEHTNFIIPSFSTSSLNGWTAYGGTDTTTLSYQYDVNILPPTDIQFWLIAELESEFNVFRSKPIQFWRLTRLNAEEVTLVFP